MTQKIYLYVPYQNKEDAKSYGAKFDLEVRKWYIESNNLNKHIVLEKYPDINPYEKVYLQITYDEKDDAKELGARFDGKTKKWYITKGHENYLTLINMYELYDADY